MEGAEFQITRSPVFDSFLLHGALLNRDPTSEERESARSRLASGIPLDNLLLEIFTSPEFSLLLQ